MPFLLYAYLLSEMVAPFLASLTILTAIMFLGRLLQIFDTVFALGISPADFLRLSLYILPKLMMFSLPLASMFGVILCFGRLASDNELLALRAAGTGPAKIVPPVIIFALAISTLAGYFSMTLMPQGLVNVKLLMLKLAQEKVDRGIRAGGFSDSLGGIVIYVDRIQRDNGKWQGVYIYDGRKKEQPIIVTAGSGQVTADYDNLELVLELDRGAITTGNPEKMQHIDFASYALSLPVPLTGDSHGPSKHAEMDQQRLKEIFSSEGKTGINGRDAFIEYQQRFGLAVGCFILTMLGLPFAARTAPGRKQTAVPIGIACFLTYYIMFSYAETLAEQGQFNMLLTLWLPNTLFGSLALINLALMGQESSGRLAALLTKLSQLLPNKKW